MFNVFDSFISKVIAHYNLDRLSAQYFIDIYSLNVIGVCQMSSAVMPKMKGQAADVVVNSFIYRSLLEDRESRLDYRKMKIGAETYCEIGCDQKYEG